MTITQLLFNVGNYLAILASILLVLMTWSHYRFFNQSKQNELSKRIRDVFLADILSVLSLFGYSLVNIVVKFGLTTDADYVEVRAIMKVFQALCIVYTLYASYKLHKTYIKIQ